MAEQLAGSRTADAIVAVLRGSARELAGCDGIAVVLRDGELCRYVAEDAVSPLWTGESFAQSDCISGLSMQSGRTITIADVAADIRIPQAAYARTFVKSMAMVPIGRPTAVAALGGYWATKGAPPEDAVTTLEGLAKVATSAFENVRLIKSLKEAQDHARLLSDELGHRLGNTFTIVRALALQSFRSQSGEATTAFLQRLDALGEAHRVLLGHDPASDVESILRRTLRPFADGLANVTVHGPYVALQPRTAVSLTLGMHELATNSLKYGALSSASGSLSVHWSLEQCGKASVLHLTWRERGGLPVRPPSRRGFGTRLIEQSLAHELGAIVDLSFEPEGLTAHLSAQITAAAVPDSEAEAA